MADLSRRDFLKKSGGAVASFSLSSNALAKLLQSPIMQKSGPILGRINIDATCTGMWEYFDSMKDAINDVSKAFKQARFFDKIAGVGKPIMQVKEESSSFDVTLDVKKLLKFLEGSGKFKIEDFKEEDEES